MANEIVSLADCKSMLRINDPSTDALLALLIDAATNRLELLCARKFNARDHRVWRPYTWAEPIVLRNRPIIQIARVAAGRRAGLHAKYTGTDIRATLEVAETSLIMKSLSAAGVTTTSTQLFVTYPTMSTMATQIATVAGWSASVDNDAPIDDAEPIVGQPAKDRDAHVYWPDSDTAVLKMNREAGIIYLAPPEHWRSFDPDVSPGGFQTFGRPSVLIQYRGGYESIQTADDAADLRALCAELVGTLMQTIPRDKTLSSESLGDYAYSLASGVELTERQMARLRPWQNFAVAA